MSYKTPVHERARTLAAIEAAIARFPRTSASPGERQIAV
jgi:hypothetical protein